MVILLCFRWWYGQGWAWIWQKLLIERLTWVDEVFSMSDMLRTLFAPYKQTFAGSSRGALGDQLRAFADRTISRVIGALIRAALILVALLASLAVLVIALGTLLIWPFLPLVPVLSVVCMALGVGL